MKYQVGDRIRTIARVPFCGIAVGSTGVIERIYNKLYHIKFDFNCGEQVCDDSDKCIELLEKKEVKQYGIVKFCMENYK